LKTEPSTSQIHTNIVIITFCDMTLLSRSKVSILWLSRRHRSRFYPKKNIWNRKKVSILSKQQQLAYQNKEEKVMMLPRQCAA